jgi:predicted membrane channel-forming protein YqfA (hemolysin III family)
MDTPYNPVQVLLLGVLVIFWWAGVWGILEILVQKTKRPLLFYSLMVAFVVVVVFSRPELLEHFL